LGCAPYGASKRALKCSFGCGLGGGLGGASKRAWGCPFGCAFGCGLDGASKRASGVESDGLRGGAVASGLRGFSKR